MRIWHDKKLGITRVAYEDGEKERLVNELWVDGKHEYISHNPDSPEAKQLDRLLPYLPRYEGDIYRGSEENPYRHNINVGDDFCFGHIAAFSRSQGMGEMHALKHDKGTPILYRVKDSKKGKDIKDISHKAMEEEILVPRDVHYKVVDSSFITVDGKVIKLIDLKEKEKN